MHTLRLFGSVALEGPAGPLSSHATEPRQLAVLAMLACAGREGISRDKLMACLWPDADAASARHSLSDAIYRLRRQLGRDAIQGGSTALRLNSSVVRADVIEFERAVEDGDPAAAAALYRGPFLDGFHWGDSIEFEHWRDAEARRLEQRFESVLETLADRAGVEGEHSRAADFLRRLLTLDPYNSRTVMRLMEAMAAGGDPANAIKLASEHRAFLAAELGVEPPAELLALVERLRAGAQNGVVGSARTGGALPFEQRPAARVVVRDAGFAGRDAELTRLHGFLDEALGGRGRIVFITGEAGTGKTMLAGEFCRQATGQHPELVVAGGYGNAHTGIGDPYLPFREVLGLLTGAVEARCEAGSLTPDEAMRLWQLVPLTARTLAERTPDLLDTFVSRSELCARLGRYGGDDEDWHASLDAVRNAPAPSRAAPVQAALFDQYARVVKVLARERPLLLVLDDLQWADGGSIGLLFHLARALHGSRILLCGLYRPTDVAVGRDGGRHPLEPVVNELRTVFGDVEVALEEGGDRAFVDALIDSEPNGLDAGFRASLFRQTDGHALFTVELMHALRDAGVLVRERGRWRVVGQLDWSLMPARIHAMLAERIGRLPTRLQRILDVAAIEGETFTLEVVAGVLGMPVAELLPLVSGDLERTHRLVRPIGLQRIAGHRLSEFRFRHILFQRYLYDRLDGVERAHLHARVGDALETLHGEASEEIALRLGRHFREGGMADRAAHYLLRAGVRAESAAAFPEAITHFEAALEQLGHLPDDERRDRRESGMQMKLGLARMFSGAPDALEPIERAHELGAKLRDDALRLLALTGLFYAKAHFPGDNRLGRKIVEEAMTLAGALGDEPVVAPAYEIAGRCAVMRGDWPAALAAYREMERRYDPRRPTQWDVHVESARATQSMIGLALGVLGYPDQAREHLAAAIAMARERASPATVLMMLWYDICLGFKLRDPRHILGPATELAETSAKLGLSAYWDPQTFCLLGWARARQGDPEAGVEMAGKALADWKALGFGGAMRYFTGLYAETLGLAGRAGEALRLIDDCTFMATEKEERYHEPEVLRLRGDLLLALPEPDPEAAAATYRTAIDLARTQHARLDELRAATSLARLRASQGRRDEVRAELATIYDWFTEGFDCPDLLDAKTMLGRLNVAHALVAK